MNLILKKCTNKYLLDSNRYMKIIDIIENYLNKIEKNLNECMDRSAKLGLIMVIGEIYPLLEDKEKWDEITYKIMNEVKKEILQGEIQGLSLSVGLTSIAFSTYILEKNTGYYKKFLKSINKLVLQNTEKLYNELIKDNTELQVNHYDCISGLSGIVCYLILINNDESKKIIINILKYLIKITEYSSIDGIEIPGWYVKGENQMTEDYKADYPNGSINYSISHGIAGCLVALSLSYINGIVIDKQKEAIKIILNEYSKVEFYNDHDVICWPGIVSLENYLINNYFVKNDRMSWCYGSISILRSMFLSSIALEDEELKEITLKRFEKIMDINKKDYYLESPIICHGYAGALTVLRTFYNDIKNEKIRNKMIELLDELLDCFNNDYKYGFRDIKVKKVNGIFIKEEEDNNNFFEGGTGVILELISYIKNDTSFESALLLK